MTGWALAVFVMINGVATMSSLTPMPDQATCERYARVVNHSASGQFGPLPRARCHRYG
jgi:hypothetical protein